MLRNWDLRRILYLVGGIAFIVVAVKDQAWWFALFGIYFAAMSVFRFGCAAGNCEVPFEGKEPSQKTKN